MTALIAEYNVFAAPIANVIVGNVTAAMDRSALTPGRESTLGRLIADAQLRHGDNAVVAFMNPGGIRANLDAGDVTHGEAFAVQPFSNIVTTMDLTGAQIETMLEQQFTVISDRRSASFGAVPDRPAAIDRLHLHLERGGPRGQPSGPHHDEAERRDDGPDADLPRGGEQLPRHGR